MDVGNLEKLIQVPLLPQAREQIVLSLTVLEIATRWFGELAALLQVIRVGIQTIAMICQKSDRLRGAWGVAVVLLVVSQTCQRMVL
jgi:hypothetical protein